MSTDVFAVAVAGALGAPARFLLEQAITRGRRRVFPWGTLIVNLLGCLALGVLAGAIEFHGWSADVRMVAGTGFLGAFTTFSAFAVETNRLPLQSQVMYGALSVGGGLAAAALGLALLSI